MISQPNISFQNKWKEALKLHFGQRNPSKQKIANYELILEVVASAVLGAYGYWLQNPEKVDSYKLSKIVGTCLNLIPSII